MHRGWRNSKSRHLFRFEPDAHSERTFTKNVGALDATDRTQFGLDNARHVVRDLVLVEIRGREAQVHRGKLRICGFEVNYRSLGFSRQVLTQLGALSLYLGESRIGIVGKLQWQGNRA